MDIALCCFNFKHGCGLCHFDFKHGMLVKQNSAKIFNLFGYER